MRTRLRQTLSDLKVLDQKLDHVRRPIAFARAAQPKIEKVEKVLETFTLGLSVAEFVVDLTETDEEGEAS